MRVRPAADTSIGGGVGGGTFPLCLSVGRPVGELGRGRAGTGRASPPICRIYGWTVTRVGRPAKRRCAATDYRQVSP